MKKAIALILSITAFASSGTAALAEAGETIATAYTQTLGFTSIPVGHAQFCEKRPERCQPNLGALERMTLTPALWDQLQRINNTVNTTVTPVNDRDLYGTDEFWTYPTSGYGDCEDFVLAKRQALIEAGWAPSVLLITVVREPDGEGHAVLTVRTDRGDLVLDNQDGMILVWTDTPYTYLKRQAQAHAGQWVDLDDPRAGTLVANR